MTVGAGAALPRVPVAAQASSRAQFLAGAAERRAALAPVVPSRHPRPAGWGASWLARTLATTLMVLGGLGLGGYGVVAASAPSLPGDPLYGVKRSVEQTELLLAANTAARAQLQTEFDDRRVREAQAVASAGRLVAVDFTGTLISMDGAQGQHWLVSGVAVLVGPQVVVVGTPVLGARVRIEGAVQGPGLIQAQRVTVLSNLTQPAPATPTAASTGASPVPSQPATLEPARTPTPTQLPPVETQAPAVSATPSASPAPKPTEAVSPTDDHGGGPGPSASNTPEPTQTDGGGPGPSASNTPKPTDAAGGGGPGPSASNTPQPTEINDDHGGTQIPASTDDGGGGPSPSNTPQPTSGGGGGSPSNTPRPTDGGSGDGGGGSGPSPSNTPKPGD
jgi:hypothetical protein